MEEENTRIYNVLIIGAGKIGAFFDQPGSENILTHAHAFAAHPGFQLAGFVDSDTGQAQKAASIWGGEYFNNLDEALHKYRVDVVCLAVPDEYHYPYLQELAHRNINIIFAEKPLTKTLPEAREIKQRYSSLPISVQLNYSRRFVPEIITLRNNIRDGLYGRYLSGTGYYGKGLLHNGSHLLDLLLSLLGDVSDCRLTGVINDFYDDDPSVSAVLTMAEGTPFFLQSIDCRAYTIFEMDLLFERRRVRLIDSGFVIEEYEIRESPLFAGYRNPLVVSEQRTSLSKSIYYAAENIYQHLDKGEELLCRLDDGVKVLSLCWQLKEGLQV
ncbi:Gfo/Idh/MocA family protein [Syntrophomonas wolfei]|jgi:predicted dehydrogenase|uniref:Gfo/Idh/MocA family protein n=1 Tax=Syntrophomonas wolfei TaxID=863 RepID=UPI0023F4CD44|nr:Gfo/Idh/MocA family oxidoreductase [Syntrophomonas wolfei]